MSPEPDVGKDQDSRGPMVLGFLVLAQFLMTLDSTVMNVSIASLVEDLDTTVSGIQTAITLYTLVMAAFMMSGGKLGDVWGRLRTYRIGLLVYALGSGITALAPNLGVLIIGWSVLEGLGAILIMPAVASLIAGNFTGKRRATAFGTVAAAAAAAAAVGPIIGGFVTTAASWRYVFVAEAVLCLIIFTGARIIKDAPVERRPSFDFVGALLSAASLGLIVFGVLQSSSWGWIIAKGPIVNGRLVAPLNLSLVLWMILTGIFGVSLLLMWGRRRLARGLDPLMTPSLLKNVQLRSGVIILLFQMVVIAGLLFTVPLYLSVVLGRTALETGLSLLPLSITLVATAVGVPRLFPHLSPRLALQLGLVILSLGTALLAGSFNPETASGLALPLAVIGVGVGLLSSQLGNVIVSAVHGRMTSEAGGLQYTAQNLGASLGTALLGAMLISGLTSSLTTSLADNPGFELELSQQDVIALQSQVEFVSDAQLDRALTDSGLTPEQQDEIRQANNTGRIDALRRAVGIAAVFPLIALTVTGSIPNRPLAALEEEPK